MMSIRRLSSRNVEKERLSHFSSRVVSRCVLPPDSSSETLCFIALAMHGPIERSSSTRDMSVFSSGQQGVLLRSEFADRALKMCVHRPPCRAARLLLLRPYNSRRRPPAPDSFLRGRRVATPSFSELAFSSSFFLSL